MCFYRLLHLLPPERAHSLTLWALRKGLGPKQLPQHTAATLFGKPLPSLIGLSGGADKNAEALGGWKNMGFGFVEAGTVTLEPRAGNAGTRVWRQHDGASLVNWMGLPNLGLKAFARNLGAFRDRDKDFCIGVSMASPDGKPEELQKIAETLAKDADFFTLNASCPNVSGHEAESALHGIGAQLEAAISGAGSKPVLVKLAPTQDMASLAQTVSYLAAKGAAGFIACNTVPPTSSALIPGERRPSPWPERDGKPVGGYSGPALLLISRAMVECIRKSIGNEKIILGVGGIASPEDAQSLLDAGANAVQLYTALTWQGPGLVKRLNRSLQH